MLVMDDFFPLKFIKNILLFFMFNVNIKNTVFLIYFKNQIITFCYLKWKFINSKLKVLSCNIFYKPNYTMHLYLFHIFLKTLFTTSCKTHFPTSTKIYVIKSYISNFKIYIFPIWVFRLSYINNVTHPLSFKLFFQNFHFYNKKRSIWPIQ